MCDIRTDADHAVYFAISFAIIYIYCKIRPLWSRSLSALVPRVNEINYSINHWIINLIYQIHRNSRWSGREDTWRKKQPSWFLLFVLFPTQSDRQMMNPVNRCLTSNWIRQKGGEKHEGGETQQLLPGKVRAVGTAPIWVLH